MALTQSMANHALRLFIKHQPPLLLLFHVCTSLLYVFGSTSNFVESGEGCLFRFSGRLLSRFCSILGYFCGSGSCPSYSLSCLRRVGGRLPGFIHCCLSSCLCYFFFGPFRRYSDVFLCSLLPVFFTSFFLAITRSPYMRKIYHNYTTQNRWNLRINCPLQFSKSRRKTV